MIADHEVYQYLSDARRGAVLLIVVGLAAVLLAIAGAILAMNRSEAMDGALVTQDAQARLMLVAGLCYIQESSRLGWNEETYGWTDVRNGTPGPRGPRDPQSGVIPKPQGWSGYQRDDDNETDPAGSKPAPEKSDPTRLTSPHDQSSDSGGGSGSGGRWPMSGSSARCDVYAMRRPPYALQTRRHYNPVSVPSGKVPADVVDEWERAYDGKDVSTADKTYLGHALNPSNDDLADYTNLVDETVEDPKDPTKTIVIKVPSREDAPHGAFPSETVVKKYQKKYWNDLYADYADNKPGYVGLMNPQPVSDSLQDYLNGDPAPRPESTGRSWFRVYRETQTDHDGDGTPWYDSVPMSGHGIFIITCGAGATKGFFDWSEVMADSAGSQFLGGREMFEDLRARERILWFRAEWTAATGGGFNARDMAHLGTHDNLGSEMLNHPVGEGKNKGTGQNREYHLTPNTSLSYFGSFKWIQRLERQPPKW